MDVRLPDGTIVKNVPDNITKAELTNKLVAAGYSKSLGGEAPDPTSPTTGGRLLEGIGQGMHLLYQGGMQRMGQVTPQEVAETRRLDAPLLSTWAGIAGSMIGSALPAAAATMIIPGANTAVGAALTGGAFGAAQPTVEGEDVATNAIKSGLFSLGGHALGKALFSPLKNRNAAPRQDLIDLARGKFGIDLPASTRTGNKPLAYIESQLAATPGGGRMADMLQQSNEQYARAVMAEAGAPGQLATQSALDTAKKGTQSAYQQLWARNLVKADQQFFDDLVNARDFAARTLTPEKVRVVDKQIDNLLSKVKPGDVIDGEVYQMFLRPEIRGVAAGDSSLKAPLKAVQRALDSAAMRSIPSADANAVQRLNYQYAVQKKLASRMADAEARGGTFSPSAVRAAVGPDFQGNIGELAKIGPLLREPPQSGTAPRALAQYLTTGVPASGLGAAYGYSEGGGEGALYGGALGLLSPAIASRALSSPAVQGYLSQGIVKTSPQQAAMIGALLRAGAIPMPRLIDASQQ